MSSGRILHDVHGKQYVVLCKLYVCVFADENGSKQEDEDNEEFDLIYTILCVKG